MIEASCFLQLPQEHASATGSVPSPSRVALGKLGGRNSDGQSKKEGRDVLKSSVS